MYKVLFVLLSSFQIITAADISLFITECSTNPVKDTPIMSVLYGISNGKCLYKNGTLQFDTVKESPSSPDIITLSLDECSQIIKQADQRVSLIESKRIAGETVIDLFSRTDPSNEPSKEGEFNRKYQKALIHFADYQWYIFLKSEGTDRKKLCDLLRKPIGENTELQLNKLKFDKYDTHFYQKFGIYHKCYLSWKFKRQMIPQRYNQ